MFIITNTCFNGEYTPSKAETLKEAQEWMKECTAGNIRSGFGNNSDDLYSKTDDEVIAWAKENVEGFVFTETSSKIYYNGESYNIMNIYNIDEI